MSLTLPRLLTLAATTILAMLPAMAQARATNFVMNIDVPVDGVVTLTCGLDTIEDVHVTGTLHVLFHITVDDAGGMHVDIHDNPQGTTGVGLTSGTAYHAVGSAQVMSESNGPTDQMEISHQAVFGLISEGQAANFDFVAVVHSTVNAGGDVTVDLSEIRMECH
jgi:hypothetical protein